MSLLSLTSSSIIPELLRAQYFTCNPFALLDLALLVPGSPNGFNILPATAFFF
jgi:hypothetical protein